MGQDDSPLHTPAALRAAWAVWLANALQFYDFFLFGTATVLYLGPVFFPDTELELVELAAFASIGAGFLSRPLGAVLLGHLADRYGRRSVIVSALVLMGISTAAMGMLPSYRQAGLLAPISLIALRLLQGIAISGGHASSSALVLELSSAERRGVYASLVLSGTQIGVIGSSLVFILLSWFMPEQDIRAWGWRIPFWSSLALVAVGIWLHYVLPESPRLGPRSVQGGRPPPFRTLWARFRKEVGKVVLAAQISVVSIIFGVYSLSWAVRYTKVTQATMLWLMTVNAMIAVLAIPLWGYLSDRIGRRSIFLIGAAGCCILVWPYFWSLGAGNAPLAFFLGITLAGIFYSAANGVWPSLYGEMFPSPVRVSGVAIGTQIGFTLAAQAPVLVAFIAQRTPSDWTYAALLTSVCCVVSASVIFLTPETYDKTMQELDTR